MAHFYGNLQGNRGETTRAGTKGSGINCHIRGWNLGVEVFCEYNEKTKKDEISIYKTKGSNRSGKKLIKKITE
jgi:hypothetical protein